LKGIVGQEKVPPARTQLPRQKAGVTLEAIYENTDYIYEF